MYSALALVKIIGSALFFRCYFYTPTSAGLSHFWGGFPYNISSRF